MESPSNRDLVNTLDCIGVDERIHHCIPWEDHALCGVEVKRKSVVDSDWSSKFNCWNCDNYLDEKERSENIPIDPGE